MKGSCVNRPIIIEPYFFLNACKFCPTTFKKSVKKLFLRMCNLAELRKISYFEYKDIGFQECIVLTIFERYVTKC
jgi:hypothetical protein